MPAPISRRTFLKTGLAALTVAGNVMPTACSRRHFDLVIKDGFIVDGTGGPAWKADLGIKGDSIAALGNIDPEQGHRVIPASGLHVCPGFIDIHSHSDNTILSCPTAESRVFQGVTTEITGNCGFSVVPLAGIDADKRRLQLQEEENIQVDLSDVASYFALLEETGISVNLALLVGQGTLRQNAIGLENRQLSADELKAVVRALEETLDQGAIGLSTGLEYVPGSYTPAGEIAALTSIVAGRGGLYATHIRNEAASLLGAIGEAVDIGRQTGVRVEISHLKASGKPNWDKQASALDLIETARSSGIEIMADAYPYTAYSTSLTFFLAPWVQEGGAEAIVGRILDREKRSRIRREVDNVVLVDPGGYDLIVIIQVKTEKNGWVIGKNLVEIGEVWKIEPADALLRLLEEEETGVEFVGYGMQPENVEMVLSHPLVMIGSDGASMSPKGKAAQSRPHPRSYGTYPLVLGHYVRERGILDLPTAIKKMTGMPADHLGLTDRGRISRRMKADLVVFDAAAVRNTATFDTPHQYPVGMKYILVNGVLVVENGKHTGARPGKVLRKA
ncbi:MAG TPA: D-aminoacylase [archaeon]|nr:D-aminoacylase [archaeon]